MVIKHQSFKHGWFYHYRVHLLKTQELCIKGLEPLKDYLNSLFNNCPDDYFNIGPRSSELKFNLNFNIKKITNHEVCSLADIGLNLDEYKTAHSKVQIFMLQNDNKTLAVEVPLWLLPNELEFAKQHLNYNQPLTGHIDALRIEDSKIWIWDFKPNAHKEKYASTQVYFYALMLSKRTNIPLDNFMCGYFDEKLAYIFKPEIAK